MTPRPKDHPETDPHVRELGGFDVTRLSVDALTKAGVTVGGLVSVQTGKHRAWKTHSEFLADVLPAWDVIDRAYARAITAQHVLARRARVAELEAKPDEPEALAELGRLRTSPLRGLHLPRSFPCLGMLRVLEERGRLVVVQCDVCGFEFGAKTEPDPRDEESDDRGRRRKSKPTGDGKAEAWGF